MGKGKLFFFFLKKEKKGNPLSQGQGKGGKASLCGEVGVVGRIDDPWKKKRRKERADENEKDN